MDVASQKLELINWITMLADESTLEEVLAIKRKEKMNFDTEMPKVVSIQEARKRSKEFVENLPWKK
ncbi:MAG: hypothetical protein RIR48_3290 [Bacteroidota bacterium]